MSNELALIETTIHKGDAFLLKAEGYGVKAVQMKKSAGLTYIEARVLCQNAGLTFDKELAKFTDRKRSQVYSCMKIADARDPEAEEARQREERAERNRNFQEKHVGRPSQTDDKQEKPVEPLSATREVTDYVAAPKPPAEPPSIEERAKPLMVAWFDAPEDVRAYFLNYAGLSVKPTPKTKAERPKPVPVDPRITNAVDRYFALGDKKIWTLQRMKDQPPYPELATTGPHIEFVQTFWGCPVAEQQAILDAIKVADERNKP